ncbi:MAG TPA: GNAT family N-acetyltransferase [Propionicimonas sp.]
MTIPSDAIRAVEENLWALHRDFARLPGAEVHDDPPLLWYTAPSNNSWLNGASRSSLDPADADAMIDHVVSAIHARGRALMWHVGPSSLPVDMAARLEARGFEGSADTSMVLDIARLVPSPTDDRLVIRAVRTRADLLDWLQAWDLAIEVEPRREQHPWLEPWTILALPPDTPTELFLGRFAGEPVASSLAFTGGGAVGLYGVGTAPRYRGRGFGGAISAAAVEWGRGRGERFAILHSTEMGAPVYRRLGFQPVGELTQWVLRPPT